MRSILCISISAMLLLGCGGDQDLPYGFAGGAKAEETKEQDKPVYTLVACPMDRVDKPEDHPGEKITSAEAARMVAAKADGTLLDIFAKAHETDKRVWSDNPESYYYFRFDESTWHPNPTEGWDYPMEGRAFCLELIKQYLKGGRQDGECRVNYSGRYYCER